MPRCPSCNMFASYEGDEEPGVDSLEYDPAERVITGQVRCVKRSACCSEEMKESTFDLAIDVPEEDITAALDGSGANPDDERLEWSVEDGGFSATEGAVTTDRHGKPIKNYRYVKTLYGYEGSVHLTVTLPDEYGGATVEVGAYEADDNAPASSFDELY